MIHSASKQIIATHVRKALHLSSEVIKRSILSCSKEYKISTLQTHTFQACLFSPHVPVSSSHV